MSSVPGLACGRDRPADAQLVRVKLDPVTGCLVNQGKCNFHMKAGNCCKVMNINIHPLKSGQHCPDVTDYQGMPFLYPKVTPDDGTQLQVRLPARTPI